MNALSLPVLSCACLAACFFSRVAYANECATTRISHALSERIVAVAMNEYATFNGHRIDAAGRLWKFGSTETENEPLLDPATGKPYKDVSHHVAWRRVWEYWLVLDQHVPGIALSRKVVTFPDAPDGGPGHDVAKEQSLRELFAEWDREPSVFGESLRQAVLRAALNDSPWSAAFISYVMHQSGLDGGQFRYAAAHWQYVKAAFSGDQQYAYRACDPRHTQPRQGDLLCYSRGALAPEDFAAWRSGISRPGFSAASHCEIVVMVDRTASKMETVGGNVLQSVTRRRLKLNQEGHLSSGHYPTKATKSVPPECAQDRSCVQPNLNIQQWSVLLQLR